ncbi:MAG: hypothetical protein LBR25_00135 [Erysipelotrichaceae bacterium]|jgi:PTS system N-acetylgalactosamine-specific IIA component|nr:hypothetical protein [Erysipelotrichaceae bacterium]
MKQFVLMGHGCFPEGIKSALSVILGEKENVLCLNFTLTKNKSQLEKEFALLMQSLKDSEVVVLCDLYGGAPFNVAAEALHKGKCSFKLFYGINLSILLEMVIRENDPDFWKAESVNFHRSIGWYATDQKKL